MRRELKCPFRARTYGYEHTQAVGLGYDKEGPFRANGEHTQANGIG